MKRFDFTYKFTALLGLALMAISGATAQNQPLKHADVCGVTVDNIAMKRNADLMKVDMELGLDPLKINDDRAVVLAPVIINGTDSLELQPVGLYSRTRWYQYLRAGEKPLGGDNEASFRYSERPETFEFSQTVAYEEWMNGSQLYLHRCDYGCCRTLIDEELAPLMGWRERIYTPAYRYVRPAASAQKVRELAGRAYIDFPVNRTELYPDYRKNPIELAKIIATIDSIRNDKDVTVKRITIKGWASPESPWENNTRLAKGRTATLKQYVRNLYNFDDDFIATDYYPEDWFGLRDFVEKSNLEHKAEILALIDDDTIEPDPKEHKLKTTYPQEYKFLLATVYPGLRHSDYTIEYTIREFTEADEIREIMRTAPQKLSLNEMFILAQSLEEGSDEFNEVFETAVRMFPDDEMANLNAANAAMIRKDFKNAEKYLAKAGDSADAVYARGVYAAQCEDYAAAAAYFSKVSDLTEAQEALEQIRDVTDNQ